MVVISCELSLSVRRHSPDEDSTTYKNHLDRFMVEICQNASCSILSSTDPPSVEMPSYLDKMVKRKYDISSRLPRYAQVEEKLLEVSRQQSQLQHTKHPNVFYYFMIDPEPDSENLSACFEGFPLETFALGFMSSPIRFHTQFHYQMDLRALTGSDPVVNIEIDSQELGIKFVVSKSDQFLRVARDEIASTTEVYSLMIDFQQLSYTILVNQSDRFVDLCFFTKTPIQLWRTQHCFTGLSRLRSGTRWIRTCSITSTSTFANQCDINKTTLGGSSSIMLRFTSGPEIRSILQSLATYGGFSVYHTVLEYRPKTVMTQAPPVVELEGNNRKLDDINWMLAALHSIGYRIRYQLEDEIIGARFMKMVDDHVRGGKNKLKHVHNALCRAYDILAVDTEDFLHIDRVLQHCLQLPPELNELVSVHSKLVKRLVVSPSRILFQAPCLNHDNRILREFDPDSAVSCSFQNDDLTKFSSVANSWDFVDETVGELLRNGVVVANRHYEFLGCSGSQLKDIGCWLYAKDPNGKTAEDIRSWMGDLDHIRNPGTYLSRMGQCFSDTTAAELDTSIEIEWHGEDVEGGQDPDGKPYCFSDGVGRISEECMKVVFTRMPDETLPSAFQIRLGGSKGMLTLDHRLTGKTIVLRESMYKFLSTHATVEVMRRAQPTPLFLNCQIITVLSQLEGGIPDHVFIKFLYNMLHKMADVLLDDQKALVSLSSSGFSCCYSKLYKAGLKFTTDPFFKGILKAIACARISNVKKKARIEVPPEYGRYMLGVMDEVGVLEYGEVFVQYSADIRKPKQNPIVQKGVIVVSKMPCFHPGDARKFEAVDRPELRHLVDCIVFPSKGPRPHPNEMAGSDLDGDEYFVTWHPDLIFKGRNARPMDFPSIRKNQQDDPITVEDMVKFIVDYIVNDKVGVVANAHLAWADQTSIYSEQCIRLAKIFSHVIDFSKTGYLPDEVKGRNVGALLPKKYPDFMGKQDHQTTYPSKKVMGKLYRISGLIEQAVSTIDKEDTDRIQQGSNWIIDDRFIIPGHEHFIETAEKLYDMYAECLDTEQRRYGIESEEELVSGCVIKIQGMYSRSDQVFDIERRLQERMKDVRRFITEKFNEFLENAMMEGVAKKTQKLMFAAACYVITYKNKRKHRSFPWMFADQLLIILQKSDKPGCDAPLEILTKSVQAVDIKRVEHDFRYEFRIKRRPVEDDMARIYLVLINWGKKTKFVAGPYPSESPTLTVAEFTQLIDYIVEKDPDVVDSLDDDAGPLLIAICKGITNFQFKTLIDGKRLNREALIRMKGKILLAHHQLARDPRVESLMIQKEKRKISRRVWVDTDRWGEIKHSIGKLHKLMKEKFNVHTEFRRKKNGGLMWIRGEDESVFDCEEFWTGDFDASVHLRNDELERLIAELEESYFELGN